MTTKQILDYMDGLSFFSESFGLITFSNGNIYSEDSSEPGEFTYEEIKSLYDEYFTTRMYPELSAFN